MLFSPLSFRDPKFPFAKNVVLPGTGAFIKAVEVASGRDATILGKPEKFMFQVSYPLVPPTS